MGTSKEALPGVPGVVGGVVVAGVMVSTLPWKLPRSVRASTAAVAATPEFQPSVTAEALPSAFV